MVINELRETFLNFFKERGHTIVSSDSLVPSCDPTLLFTSAGMVQFKRNFLGQTSSEMKRATSSQKCLRMSDINRVGITSRHNTFFEMLGNFSFGDYFKKEAIEWGWEFLTKICNISPIRLYVSVYKEDDESLEFWKKFLPESKIVRLGEDSNFWNMGATGPCGPCSEMIFDQGEKMGCGKSSCQPGCDCERYLELWNLVFTQFDRESNGHLLPLPQKNIDTGMGLERIGSVVNGLKSVYESDLLFPLVKKAAESVGKEELFLSGIGDKSADRSLATSLKIIADHSRAVAFLIGDGVLPSNEKRGYVCRRLLRNAIVQGKILGRGDPFLFEIVDQVIDLVGTVFPDLIVKRKNIATVVKAEEEQFYETLQRGWPFLQESLAKAKDGGKIIPGEIAFKLHDTYGILFELVETIAQQSGLEVDREGFGTLLARQKEMGRSAWKGSGEKEATLYLNLQRKVGETLFVGYEKLESHTQVISILKLKQTEAGWVGDWKRSSGILEPVDSLQEDEAGEIVLAETPFYAESGGQVGDQGEILNSSEESPFFSLKVLDTQHPVEGFIVHKIKVQKGNVKTGDRVIAKVNETLRKDAMRHHTATHLLHSALRKILGTHITQAGSLVSPEKLRFDFTYPKTVSEEEIAKIEREVNHQVYANINRKRNECSLEEARQEGALAFFGDRYREKVFVVSYGNFSSEVCGGTHCQSTGEIGFFKIVSESSIGSGLRRIEAVAGERAVSFVQNRERIIQSISKKLRSSVADSPEKMDQIIQKQAELESELLALRKSSQKDQKLNLLDQVKDLPFGSGSNGRIKIVSTEVESSNPESLRETADFLREKIGSGIVLLVTRKNERLSFVVTLTKDSVEKGFHAGKIAEAFAKVIGGRGGGKESFAQGGGGGGGGVEGDKPLPNLKKVLESFPQQIVEGQGSRVKG